MSAADKTFVVALPAILLAALAIAVSGAIGVYQGGGLGLDAAGRRARPFGKRASQRRLRLSL